MNRLADFSGSASLSGRKRLPGGSCPSPLSGRQQSPPGAVRTGQFCPNRPWPWASVVSLAREDAITPAIGLKAEVFESPAFRLLDMPSGSASTMHAPPAMAFPSISDEKIQELARMPKRVKNPTAHLVTDANHQKKDFLVESRDGTEQFKIFFRQSKTVANDFSCGIIWFPRGDESLILARFNGSSHVHVNRMGGEKMDCVCHVHRTTERYIQNNLSPDGHAIATASYKTASGALAELAREFKVTGLEGIAVPDQQELFNGF